MRALILALALLIAPQAVFAQGFNPAILGQAPVTYSTEAQTYFDKLTANGCQAPSRQFKAAIDAYIVTEKASSNWTSQDAEYLLVGPDACTDAINIRQPSLYALTFNGSYTLSASVGFNTDGSTGYADTGVNQSGLVLMTQNNAHISTWSLAKGNFQLGLAGSSSGVQLNVGSTRTTRLTSATSVTDTATLGYNWADRTGSTTIVTGLGASTLTAAGSATSAALIAAHVLIGRVNTSSMPVNTNMVFAGFGAAMTDESAHYTHLRTLLLALGISVP